MCSLNWLCQGCPPIELMLTLSEEMPGCRMILPSALQELSQCCLHKRELSMSHGAHRNGHGHNTGTLSDRRSRFAGMPQIASVSPNGNTSAYFSIHVAHVESPGRCKVLSVNLSTEVKCACFSHRGISLWLLGFCAFKGRNSPSCCW